MIAFSRTVTRDEKRYLVVSVAVMALIWIIFKLLYPFIDICIDSYTYLVVARYHETISLRPIGYSIFLQLIHSITNSDTVVATIQYFLFQAASLSLFFTIRRFYKPGLWLERLLLAFIVLNPFVLYLCNSLMSDALFAALTLFWLTTLIRLIWKPTWSLLCWQLVLLFMAFNVRYSAMFYPIIAIVAFLMVKKRRWFKVTGVVTTVVMILSVRAYIKHITFELTGVPNFTAFTGWQLANNAMHVYPWVPVDTTGFPTPESREVARYTWRYFENPYKPLQESALKATVGYMWFDLSPLRKYRLDWSRVHSPADTTQYLGMTDWNRLSPIFSDYGKTVITKHPLAFAWHYLWPSAKGFFLPDLDIFKIYNEGKKELLPIAQEWFGLPDKKVRVCSFTAEAKILAPIPWLYLFLNLAYLVASTLFFSNRNLCRSYPQLSSSAFLVFLYIAANTAFTIYASPSVLRYHGAQMILLAFFTVFCLSAWIGFQRNGSTSSPRGTPVRY